MSDDEMMRGYMDGRDHASPEPNANRSHSYRHGFANGRDDLNRKPRATAHMLRQEAAEAMDRDRQA
jgi:hypothetical protein